MSIAPRKVETPKDPWLERAISWLSPEWAHKRQAFRAQTEELASYRGARHARLGRGNPTTGRADYHLETTYDRRELVDRARQLERSSVIAEGLLSRATENVVGCGFRLQAQSRSDAWNEAVEAAWVDWAEFDADVRGLSPMSELLALTYRSWLRDGDVGTILLADGALQHFESDQLANPDGSSIPTREMVDGIKLDRRGRPISYHVATAPDPKSAVRFGQVFTEIPAKNVLFLARRQRIGQTRGLSAFSGVAWLLDQIDGQIEAVTAAARMAACMGLVVARKGRMSGLNTDTNSNGETVRKLTFEPGMLWELAEGDQVTQVNPSQPSGNFPDFLATLGRLVGLAFGLPLEVAFLDFSRTNYSSARASLLQAHQVWQTHQQMLSRYMSRIYRWWLVESMRSGRIPARRDALSHTWITPGWKWVDPEKELKAQLGAVDAGVMTLSDIAMQQGRDFAELVGARKREVEMIREAGLPEVLSTMTRDVRPEPAAPAAPMEPDDVDDPSA